MINETDYIKVKGRDDIFRDPETNAILNCDEKSYNDYIMKYKKAYSDQKRLKTLETDVNEIKNDLNEIKNLLISLSQNK